MLSFFVRKRFKNFYPTVKPSVSGTNITAGVFYMWGSRNFTGEVGYRLGLIRTSYLENKTHARMYQKTN